MRRLLSIVKGAKLIKIGQICFVVHLQCTLCDISCKRQKSTRVMQLQHCATDTGYFAVFSLALVDVPFLMKVVAAWH
jgi:hypothetical protein